MGSMDQQLTGLVTTSLRRRLVQTIR